MTIIFDCLAAYLVPIVLWIVLKRKKLASTIPLITGIIAYVFISYARGLFRLMLLNDSVKEHPWLFYTVSALISAVCEEVGRYLVFRYAIPKFNHWKDCVSYGIGHSATEIILTHHVIGNDFIDNLLIGHDFATTISFSVAMAVLVFSSVHHADTKKGLAAAVGLHTVIDIIPAAYFCGYITIGNLMLVDLLYIMICCYFAYRVYRHFKEIYSGGDSINL